MEPLQGNEAIQQFMKLLQENNREGQAADLSQLLEYMDYMNRQYDAVFQELQEVKFQLAREKQPAVQKIMQGVAAGLENKLEQIRDVLADLREQIAAYARTAVEKFKEAGVSALDKAVSVLNVRDALESVQEKLGGMIAGTKQNMEKVENIGRELRSVGGHLVNAGRALAGKEAQKVEVGKEGRFQSAVITSMKATEKLLSGMNNATLAAIGGVEHLEQTAEDAREAKAEREAHKPGRRLAKKPSILQMLAEKKAEVAARSTPAPEKAHKPPEAAL